MSKYKRFLIQVIIVFCLLLVIKINNILNTKDVQASNLTVYQVQVEILKTLEDIRDNGDEILSKLDIICDRL